MAHTIHSNFALNTTSATARAPRNNAPAEASRAMAGMLLSAVVAAVLVVADQLVETWTDGNLLLVWVALWVVAFVALALLAQPLRHVARKLAAALARWSEARAQRLSDAAMWRVAQQDSRVMRELQLAVWHGEGQA